MVHIWEDNEVVFWAEFTPRNVRVLRHLGGEWEAALKQKRAGPNDKPPPEPLSSRTRLS